MPSSSRG